MNYGLYSICWILTIHVYIYIYVLLLSPAHSAQTFFLGRTRICWPFRPIQCNADAWQSDVLNHCVLSGGCLPKSYVKRWVICKRLLEERLLTLVQDNKSYPECGGVEEVNRISCGNPTSNMGVACVAAVTRAQRPDLFSGAHKNLLLAIPAHTVQCGCMAI